MKSETITGSHVRWMIRRDMPEVLAIENESFEFPMSEEQIVKCLRKRNVIGMVSEVNDRVVAYMLYELHKTRLHLASLAVARDVRRAGIGSSMVQRLQSKLSRQRRCRLTLEVRDGNLSAQLFFRSNGFRAVSVLRNHYEDTSDDAYLMEYSV